MKISILMSSGDEDEYEKIMLVVPRPDGAIYVVSELEIPFDQVDDGTPIYSDENGRPYRLEAEYAAGMWMRVQYGDD